MYMTAPRGELLTVPTSAEKTVFYRLGQILNFTTSPTLILISIKFMFEESEKTASKMTEEVNRLDDRQIYRSRFTEEH